MLIVKGKNYKAVAMMHSVKCTIYNKEKKTAEIIYNDNTKTSFKDVKYVGIKQNNKIMNL